MQIPGLGTTTAISEAIIHANKKSNLCSYRNLISTILSYSRNLSPNTLLPSVARNSDNKDMSIDDEDNDDDDDEDDDDDDNLFLSDSSTWREQRQVQK